RSAVGGSRKLCGPAGRFGWPFHGSSHSWIGLGAGFVFDNSLVRFVDYPKTSHRSQPHGHRRRMIVIQSLTFALLCMVDFALGVTPDYLPSKRDFHCVV